jgi:uncharacterized lipoprotein YajG
MPNQNESRGRIVKKLGIILSVLLLGAGFIEARGSEQAIQVEYKPNAKVKRSPSSVPSQKIFFEEFRDQRSHPRLLGENLEDKGNRVLVVSSDPQAAGNLVKSALSKEFNKKGFFVVGSPGQAEKIIGGSLIKFWTIETNRYNTETLLKLEVHDKNGRVLFQKNYSGAGKNFGRSLSETNYNESFSDSLVMIVDDLFSDQEFLRALSEKPAILRAEEKAPRVPPVAPSSAPPAPATTEPLVPSGDYIFHKVHAGETLATIAKWYSGNANNWKVLASYNLDKEPFKLKAQEVVKVPLALASVNREQPGFSTASPKAGVRKGKKTASPSPAAPGPPLPVTGPAFGPK